MEMMCKEEAWVAQALGAGSWDRLDVEQDSGESSPWLVGHSNLPFQAFLRTSLEQDGQELCPNPGASSCLGFPRAWSDWSTLSSGSSELLSSRAIAAILRAFQRTITLLSHGTYRETPALTPTP